MTTAPNPPTTVGGTGQPATEADPFDDLAEEAAPRKPPGPAWLTGPGAWGFRRPAWASLVALIFLVNAIREAFSASMLSMPASLLPAPIALFGIVHGVAALAAAFGVYRGLAWGRWLGLAVVISWLAREIPIVESWLRAPTERGAPNLVLDILLPLAVQGTILVLLLLRWPRDRADGSAGAG